MECTLFKRISDKLEWLKIKFFNLFARKRKVIPVYENLTEFKNIHFNDFLKIWMIQVVLKIFI